MKNFLIVLLLVAGSLFSNSQPVKIHGQLKVVGTQLQDQGGKPVVLRGVSLGWHNWWPRFYNASAVKWLHADWNCSVVRAAMGIEPDGGYIKDPAGSTAKVKAVVDAAIKEGIYVIIDWHSHNINLNESKKFFAEMAATYGRYPNVIYEIFNEPDQEKWSEVKAYSTEIIATIRSKDPDNIILVGNPHWDQDINIAADDPITGQTNLMYTMHYYAATHKQWLRDRCDYALKKGLPLFISESAGMQSSGNGALDFDEWKKYIDWAEKNKISWITWSISDKNESCSMLLPEAGSDGGWKEKDMRESGIKTRSMLNSYPSNK